MKVVSEQVAVNPEEEPQQTIRLFSFGHAETTQAYWQKPGYHRHSIECFKD
jgi:hypothetical protein